MRTRIIYKKQRRFDRPLIRIMMNLFFICIFTLNLFLQHLGTFSSVNVSSSYSKSSSELNKDKQPKGSIFSAITHQESSPFLPEMEVSEDEENESSQDEFSTNRIQKFDKEELAFNGALQSRYLQLVTSRNRQTRVDFFILYHSWKKHIA